MSHKAEKNRYGTEPPDQLTPEEDFSLEEILAEYGGSLEQQLLRDVEEAVEEAAEETPAAPEEKREAPPREAPALERQEAPLAEEEQPAPAEEETDLSLEETGETEPPPAVPEEDLLPEIPGVPEAPRPISLEEVVGSTVDAVMEENAEQSARETPPRRSLFSRRTFRRPRRGEEEPEPEEDLTEPVEPIGPELAADEAAEEYRGAYMSQKKTQAPAMVLAFLTTVPLILERAGLTIPYWTGDLKLQGICGLACILITAVLCRQVFTRAVSALCKKRFTSGLLASLTALAAAADCVACLVLPERSQVPPYVSAACLVLAFAQWGGTRESRGMYDTFRAAALDQEPPYLVTDMERGACKQRGCLTGFYTAAVRENVTSLWQTALLPVVLMAAFVFAGLSSLGQGRGEDFFLNGSALLAAGATCALPLSWALPYSRLARQLQKMGCAVAGWSGAEKLSRRKCMILTDTDLFPPGTIQLNGVKIYGEERRKVASCAAAMVRRSGCGLERLFDGLLRSESARCEEISDFSFYEEGGWSAVSHGETILMGTASFMRKMEVRLPGDVNLKTGVFLAIDHRLAAVFAVKYNPAENVDFALGMLMRCHITPVLAARDPNIGPALIKRKFRRGVKVEYPDLTERVALSEAERDRDLPRALLFREGLMPYAETVAGSRRMCQAVRRSGFIGLAGSILGTLLVFYLVFQSAYVMLTPLALAVFLLLWAVPVLLITDWTGRY